MTDTHSNIVKNKVNQPNLLQGCFSIFRYFMLRTIRDKEPKILFPLASGILEVLTIGLLLGSTIPGFGSYTFFQYLLPAVIMGNMFTRACNDAALESFVMRYDGNITDFICSPLPLWAFIASLIISSCVSAFIPTMLILVWAVIVGGYSLANANILGIILVLLFTGLIGASIGMFNASKATSFGQTFIGSAVVFMLIGSSDKFFTIELVNALGIDWYSTYIYFNPVFYLNALIRSAFLGCPLTISYSGIVILLLVALFLIDRSKAGMVETLQ